MLPSQRLNIMQFAFFIIFPPLTQYGFATFSMRPTIPQAYTKSKRLCMYFCIFMHSLSFYNLYAYHFFPVLSSSGHADHNEIDPADSRCPQGSRARLDGTACCINVVHKDHAPDPSGISPAAKAPERFLSRSAAERSFCGSVFLFLTSISGITGIPSFFPMTRARISA